MYQETSADCYGHKTARTQRIVHTVHFMDCSGIIDTAPFERKGKACHQGRQPIATARTAFKKSACVPLLPQVLQDGTTTGLVRIFPLAYNRAFECTRARIHWCAPLCTLQTTRQFTWYTISAVSPLARRTTAQTKGIGVRGKGHSPHPVR